MQTREQNNYIGPILFFLPLVFAFSAIYYNSTKNIKSNEVVREIFLNPPSINKIQTQIPKYHVLLPKGYKVFIKNTCLVYNGMSNGTIDMEVYLLEFDQDISYPRKFTKKSAYDGIWFGNVLYKLVKANKNTLRLKILRIQESG